MQKLQLTIPEPCHQNWHNMTPAGQGRFCNACAKEVVDFSMMTDTEVLNYFTTITHEKVCGRALPSQLDRTITRPKEPKKRLFWYWNYVVMFFMFFAKGNTVKAQGGIKPVTELSPVKSNDIRGDIAVVVNGVKEGSRVITGKVTDIAGNPVSFASIKIKGTNAGVSADVNGKYSIKIKGRDILSISAAGYLPAEVSVDKNSALTTVLQKSLYADEGVLVTAMLGGIRFNDKEEEKIVCTEPEFTASFKVKDEISGLPVNKAKLTIVQGQSNYTGSVFTGKKGMYKLKKLKGDGNYFIKVEADGFKTSEFTIDANDFKHRKKVWEVLLRKQQMQVKGATTRSASQAMLGTETRVRLGGMSFVSEGEKALYVVDGIITANADNINPDDIDEITILQAPEATALFGAGGANGAIVINTKKMKVKNLDTVTVSAFGKTTGKLTFRKITTVSTTNSSVLGGIVKGETIRLRSTITDSLKLSVTKITGPIKIYPNPVERGSSFNISVKLKQTGLHQIQITDAAGRIVLQKQINANTKDVTEKIMADNRWANGLYHISITDSKNKIINQSSFIVRL